MFRARSAFAAALLAAAALVSSAADPSVTDDGPFKPFRLPGFGSAAFACGPDGCYPLSEDSSDAPASAEPAEPAAAADPFSEALRELGFAKLRVVRTLPHAADADEFVRFVRGEAAPAPPAMPTSGRAAYLLWLLLAGFLLNLTPCVLPLVPVNLALLGAGAGRRSRKSGFALGAAFGLGIALVYGALGLFSAATGRAFGFLHGHLAFHVAFAVLFCLLALAMLDAIRIDFSRLRNLLPRRRGKKDAPAAARGAATAGALARALAAGAGSALLAGACVAPALVGALLVSAELLRNGSAFGALVPFALGLGMALPWPFLGAGLAVLPKPGRWMNRVKQLFAVLFLAAAVHFLLQALRIAVPTAPADGEWISSPAAAAVAADATGRPVLLALTADWCAACRRMESGTLREDAVLDATAGTIRLRIDCTDVDSPAVRAAMRAVGARGLPFYAILESGSAAADAPAPPPAAVPAARFRATASLPPVAEIVRTFGWDRWQVDSLLGPGQDPHVYEPTPRQVSALAASRFFFRTGMPFEEALAARAAAKYPGVKIVALEAAEPEGHDHEHGHGEAAVHGWLSPDNLEAWARTIAAELKAAEPEAADEITIRQAAWIDSLGHEDKATLVAISNSTVRAFAAWHPAYGAWAEFYGLEQIALEEDGKSPGPRALAAARERIARTGARVLLVQNAAEAARAAEFAAAAGLRVETVPPLGDDPLDTLRALRAAVLEK